MKKKYISLLLLLGCSSLVLSQIGINTPTPVSTLDIAAKNATGNFTNVDGLLIPRVDRERAENMDGIPTSTLIYVNDAATGTGTGIAVNIDEEAYYYFDGSVWLKLQTRNAWHLTGNAGTNPAGGTSSGTDFLGTTDAKDFQIKVGTSPSYNNIMRVSNANGHTQFGNWLDVSSSPNLQNPDRFQNGLATNNIPSNFTIANNFGGADLTGSQVNNFRSSAYVNQSSGTPFVSNFQTAQFNNGYTGSISGNTVQVRLDGGFTYQPTGGNLITGNQSVISLTGSSTITTSGGTAGLLGTISNGLGSTINGPVYGIWGRTSTAGTYASAVVGARGSLDAVATYSSTATGVQGAVTQGTYNGTVTGVDGVISGGALNGNAIGLHSNVSAASANGYGLYIEDVVGTTQHGIYQADTSDDNNLAGKTRVGSTVAPVATLDVTGTARVSSRTGTANTLLGVDSVTGQFTDTTLGSGLSFSGGTLSSSNIYNANGTLTANRTVNTAGNFLSFVNGSSSVRITTDTLSNMGNVSVTGSARGNITLTGGGSILDMYQDDLGSANITVRATSASLNLGSFTTSTAPVSLITNGTPRLTAISGGNVGIGTQTPNKKLEVNASSDFLRITSLASVPSTTSTNLLVIDPITGNVGQSAFTNVVGQVLRIGINAFTFNSTETALRFSAHNSALEMDNAPNGQPNFINSIIGATFTENVASSAGSGAPARTTDRINLPAGVYKVTVRASHNNTNAQHDQYFLKIIVNNSEYALSEYGTSDSGKDGFVAVEYLNLSGASSTVDFTMQNESANRNMTIIDRASPGVGQSYRSTIMIERLQ